MLNQNLLLTGDDGYNLTNSLRFRSSASAYLNRTLGTPTNSKIWTYSGWVKRGSFASYGVLLSGGTSGSAYGQIYFDQPTSALTYFDNVSGASIVTTAVYRDPSAWYHVAVSVDTTQATASNRVKIYVNGVQVTAFSSATYPTQNANTGVNFSGYLAGISATYAGSWVLFADQYLDEVNFIDGQALTPTSFGSFNALTGVWQPARYTGTYGTNGFYLPFTDNSALTTSSNVGLGRDFSGNGNYWTTNNISITAGVTYDSMTDVPTLTSATASNFAVLNPLSKTGQTVSNGNLTYSSSSGTSSQCATPTFAVGSSGKWYWEVQITSSPQNQTEECIGVVNDIGTPSSLQRAYNSAGQYFDGSSWTSYGSAWSINDVIGIAIDVDNSQITFYKNNVSQGTKTWAWNSNGNCSLRLGSSAGTTYQANFGQRPFAYTPPTGFVALNTFNLPNSTIVAGNKQMDATIWTGDNTTPRSITNAGSFQPDFVWIKSRSNAYQHNLYDSVRGAGAAYSLSSDQTAAEGGNSNVYGFLSAFNSTGFAVTQGTAGGGGAPNGNAYTNQSGSTYVGWQWKANGAAVTNTAGSISAQVSANPTAGFSVVTYTGNGTAGATVGHGLGVAPQMVIAKRRSAASNWSVSATAIGATKVLFLEQTAAAATDNGPFNSTLPSSTVITLGSSTDTNASGGTFVAYCWSEIAGYSKFGSYTGNGSTDGPFVYLGFRPKFVMIKRTDSTSQWCMYDTSRATYNEVQKVLYANLSNAEDTTDYIDILSNGFKVRFLNADINNSGGGYIYMAFAENPTKFALAR